MEINGRCIQCSDGLLPFKNRCVFYDPYCLEYGDDKICNRAAPGFSIGPFSQSQQTNYKNTITNARLPPTKISAMPYAGVVNPQIAPWSQFG